MVDKDKAHNNAAVGAAGKALFDAKKFGADPQEPVILELQRFLESADSKNPAVTDIIKEGTKTRDNDSAANSKNNSTDELNASAPIPVQEPYKFDKFTFEHMETAKKTKSKSALTVLMERKAELNNPLAAQYSAYVCWFSGIYFLIPMFLHSLL